MYLKKTLVLSALDGTNSKAVVNVEKFKNLLQGQLRLYNFKSEPQGILTLGILHEGKVLKAGLTPVDSRLYSFVLEDELSVLENAKAITCALINFKGGAPTPLLFGSSDGKSVSSTEIRLASALSLFDEEMSAKKVESKLNELEIDYDDEEKAAIESLIEESLTDEEKHYEEEEIAKPKTEKKGLFYEEVKNQITELFTSYPEEEFLTNIIPHSKWVRVDYEKNEHYYVVGLIYEEGYLKYICYGLPGLHSENPPKEMQGTCQWLPLDADKPEDFGYWISYQDADTGESIKIEVI
ncbi:MAG: hypothetical protein ACOX6H_01810 [Christensenellales bacterium]|jgi:hypothetical protein